MISYLAIVYEPDAAGLVGVLVPDLLINASGASQEAALLDATAIMQEVLADMARTGEPFPKPTSPDDLDLDGGTLVILTAPSPSKSQAGGQ